MNSSDRPWPPLIVAKHVPRLVRWRDVLLTSIMWVMCAALIDSEAGLFLGRYLERLGFGHFDTEANWPMFFERMAPFLLTAAGFALWVVIFSLRTARLKLRALVLPQPAPLAIAEEARRVGLDEATLIAARKQRIVTVHIDADGRHRIEARHG
jgi:hypothetical protein